MTTGNLETWRVLLVDNNPSSYQQARQALASARDAHYLLDWQPDPLHALEVLLCGDYHAVLVDDQIGSETALNIIAQARERGCNAPIIFINGSSKDHQQLDELAMRAGATDYLDRAEITPTLLERTVRYDIRTHLQMLRSEQMAQDEQQRLRTVLENAPAGIVMTDAQGNFTVINPMARTLFPDGNVTGTAAGPAGGYALLRMDGTPFQPDDLPLTRSLKGEVIRNEEMIIRHDDGREVNVLINATPLRAGNTIVGAVGAIRDISDLLQTGRDLQQTQQRELARARELEGIMNAVPAAVWIARDPDCKVIEANRYGYEILRMQPGQNASKSAEAEVAPAHFRLFKDGRELAPEEMPVQVAARGSAVYDFEYDIVFEDGEVRHMFGNAVPLLVDGVAVGAVSAILDITERKNVEKALAINEERYRLATDAMNGFVWDYDLINGSVYRSEGVKALTGYDTSEMSGPDGWFEIVHPEDREEVRARLAESIAKEAHFEGKEYRVRHKDGHWVWVRSHGKILHNAQGRAARIVGTTINVTAMKEAEMALRESNERFRLVLDNTPTTIYTMDTNLRYTWIHNPREDFLPTNVIGKRDDELLDADAAEVLMAPKREALATGRAVRRELIYRVGDKTVAYMVAIEPIFSEDGAIVGLSNVAMDISELAQMRSQQIEDRAHIEIQRRLIQQREQERLQIARDLHDGPLQTITAAYYGAQGLKERCAELPGLCEEVEMLRQDLHAGITELRAYASELRPPTLASFGLEKAIDAHLKDFRARHAHIDVHFEAHQTGSILPEAPRMAMYRIYQELLNNIVKHAEATQIHIRFLKTLVDAELVIEDNGKGFAPPRDWLDLARNKHLGLVGVRERAEAVGGQVEIWSSPGRGTTVRVYIPLEGQE